MSAASEVVGKALAEVAKEIRPGIDTAVLDQIAEEYLRDHGGVPAFKGYTVAGLDPFPGTLCISVDDVVVHGIPGGHILQEGELISVDCGVQLEGYFADYAYTFAVGEISDEKAGLCRVTCVVVVYGIVQTVGWHAVG